MRIINIIRAMVAVAVVLTANFVCAPKSGADSKASAMPANRSLRKMFTTRLANEKPEVILLGNSMLGEGVDPRGFSALTKKRCIKYWKGGAASAWWYLSMKNVITQAEHKPETVVIFFRDTYLTKPEFRTEGDNIPFIKDMSEANEPLLERLAYTRQMSLPSYVMHKSMPLYAQKNLFKSRMVKSVKDSTTNILLGLEPGQADKAIGRTFANENLNKELLTTRQLAAEQISKHDTSRFDERVKHSFLPHIIKAAKDNDIKLVFVRVKRRRDLDPNAEPKPLKRYISNLKNYLAEQNCEFMDYTHDERLKLKHYADGDHMSRNLGMGYFTSILAKEINPILLAMKSKDR